MLVPLKAFGAAKGRLAGRLDVAQRAELSRCTAARVIAAAAPLPVKVVCDDDEVAVWAQMQGAGVIRTAAAGLNAAVANALGVVSANGFDHAVVAHGDLPFPTDLHRVAVPGWVTIVPDRHGDGTNVLAVPLGRPFDVAYGPGSFARHAAEARRRRLPLHIWRHHALGIDIDTPEDLDHPHLLEVLSSLPTNQANPA